MFYIYYIKKNSANDSSIFLAFVFESDSSSLFSFSLPSLPFSSPPPSYELLVSTHLVRGHQPDARTETREWRDDAHTFVRTHLVRVNARVALQTAPPQQVVGGELRVAHDPPTRTPQPHPLRAADRPRVRVATRVQVAAPRRATVATGTHFSARRLRGCVCEGGRKNNRKNPLRSVRSTRFDKSSHVSSFST